MPIDLQGLKIEAIELLKRLVNTPSISREEDKTADLIVDFLDGHDIPTKRKFNNVWTISTNHFGEGVPTILLNSHHDTVRASENWHTDPFSATLEGDKLIGLGSNDAGASVVSLISSFIHLSRLPHLPYRLILAITAEEEISGSKGVRSILPELGSIDLGIVGEPTQMQVAIAEKGLIVLDCLARGKTGHSARDKGINALYIALDDIEWLRNYRFEKVSDLLGPSKLIVTQIQAGIQHNVVPDLCSFVVDIRTNEHYTNEEVIALIRQKIHSEISPRSYHLNSSRIDPEHLIVKKVQSLGMKIFGSPTLSDQSIMDFPTIKMGPGDSLRSHTPDEYVLCSKVEQGIEFYIRLLEGFDFYNR
ncbi:MAG: M20 family metallo-hydrolase [Flavobacteriales bacterium AspAUS03]